MADVKISALPAAGALAGAELVPVVQTGVTSQTTAQDIADLAVPTYAQINTALALSNNSFLFSNGSGEVVSHTEWNMDPTTKMGYANVIIQPDNLSQAPQLWSYNLAVDPLQGSPNDTASVLNVFSNLDSTANGFDFGSAGNSVTLLNLGYNYFGNGSTYGRTVYVNANASVGDGINPVTLKGHSFFNGFWNVEANVTLDGSLQGYGFQPDVDAAATTTSNFSVAFLLDTAQLPVEVNGYNEINLSPSIGSIANNSNYNGITINPTITTLTGNAGATYINLVGSLPALGNTGFTGINTNTQIADLTFNSRMVLLNAQVTTGVADFDYLVISDTNNNTSGTVKGLSINVTESLTRRAMEVEGHCNLQAGFNVLSSQGQQYGHVIGGSVSIPDATTVTGTDTLCNNMAFTVHTGDATSDWTQASLVGLTTLGFVGQITGDGTINGDINFCLNGYALLANGSIDRINNFYAAAIPSGGTATVGETNLFLGDYPFGAIGTDSWGLKILDSTSIGVENFLTRLAIGTGNKKVSSANVLFDVFDGHVVFGQTTDPVIAAEANAGTGATASLTGTDQAGSIQLDTGSGAWAAGAQATITFDKAFASAPRVVLTPTNANAAAAVVGVYVTKTTTTFVINFATADVAATTYTWDYHAFEAY